MHNPKRVSIYQPDYVRNLFNQMAGSYERMNYITSFGFCIRWRKRFLAQLGRSDRQLDVIDLLSGLGENWKYLKRRFPNARFHALDFSEAMIQGSRKRAGYIFDGKINLLAQDVLYNNLPDRHFDIVSCAYGLKTFDREQLNVLAAQISRILKPGGTFSFVEVSPPKNKVLKACYGFYLGRVIPVLGRLFLGNPATYRMLWVYTRDFDGIDAVRQAFEQHNLTVHTTSYLFGCATNIHGTASQQPAISDASPMPPYT